MRLLNKLPIQRKLALIIIISNFVLLLVVFSVSLFEDIQFIRRSSIENAKSQIHMQNQNFTKIILLDSPHFAADVISSIKSMPTIKNVFLYDANNVPKLSYTRSQTYSMAVPKSFPKQPQFRDGFLHIAEDVTFEGKKYGIVYYRFSTEILSSRVTSNILNAIYLFLVALLISIALSFFFQRIFTTPILHLADLLSRVTKDRDFDVIAKSDEENEIGKLYSNFNKMVVELKSYHAELTRKNEELEHHRNQLEDLVRVRTRKLERYTDELESFSYSVSHDLRAPLRAINGYCSLLLEEYGETLDEDAHNYLQRINSSTSRMAELIDDLLTLSRITRHELNKENINFTQLCQATVVELLQLNEKYGAIKFSVQPEMKLFGDEKLIKIMMENLIGNAAKYSQYVNNPEIQVRIEEHDHRQLIVVNDNGVGFDNKYANKLFKPFQRLHESPKFEGTGIGLTIVQRIALRHGGKVHAKSDSKNGSTFYVEVPKKVKVLSLVG